MMCIIMLITTGKDVDIDLDNYVGGAVACWDIEYQRWSWTVHLDLSTDKTK